MLRVLTLTTLFPNGANPRHGIFVETRLRALRNLGGIEVSVVAPVPWFPFTSSSFGRYADFARVPAHEQRDGVTVLHPRYPMIPKVGFRLQPAMLARAFERGARALMQVGYRFDVVDSHYLYPDAVAAGRVANVLGLPHVTTARGTDVNVIAGIPAACKRILAMTGSASRVIAVSDRLRDRLHEVGLEPAKTLTLRNGVDTELFRDKNRFEARRRLGWDNAPTIISVGNLVREKGHDLVVESAAKLPSVRIVIVGGGPQRAALEVIVAKQGCADRVRFIDVVPQSELALIYQAADVLALGSSREGWPNVLLEAMACGTPVVAADVGAVRDIVVSPTAGRVVATRDAGAFADALQSVLLNRPEPASVRAIALQFGWRPVALAYRDTLLQAVRSRSVAGTSSSGRVVEEVEC